VIDRKPFPKAWNGNLVVSGGRVGMGRRRRCPE
jgi:hypothetical protein